MLTRLNILLSGAGAILCGVAGDITGAGFAISALCGWLTVLVLE